MFGDIRKFDRMHKRLAAKKPLYYRAGFHKIGLSKVNAYWAIVIELPAAVWPFLFTATTRNL